MIPSSGLPQTSCGDEWQRLITPPNTELKLQLALLCEEVQAPIARCAAMPDIKDPVILEAVHPRPFPIETLTLQVLDMGQLIQHRDDLFLSQTCNTPIQIVQELACASVTALKLTVLLHRR